MKHFDNLQNRELSNMEIGEYFTYTIVTFEGKIFYKKGVIVSYGVMVPLNGIATSVESASKLN